MKVCYVFLFLSLIGLALAIPNEWSMSGKGHQNARFTDLSKITSANADMIVEKWVFETGARVIGTPVLFGPRLYFNSEDGFFYCISADSGLLFWKVEISLITSVEDDYAEFSPVVTSRHIILTTRFSHTMISLNYFNGQFEWATPLGSHEFTEITMAPSVSGDNVFVGIASYELEEDDDCCSFRGVLYNVNANDGSITWAVPMIGDNVALGPGEYSGVDITSSSPPIDKKRNQIYIATGELYDVPSAVGNCLEYNNSSPYCVDPHVYYDSVLAIRINDGEIVWSTNLGPGSSYNPGPIADFNMAPVLVFDPMRDMDALIIGQKSGYVYSLNPNTGEVNWYNDIGPAGDIGGCAYGGATDGEKYYVGNANSNHEEWGLDLPTDDDTVGGFWSALNISTGEIIFQLADPAGLSESWQIRNASGAIGPPTIVNDVMVVGSTDPAGHLYFIDTSDFTILGSISVGASIYGGAAVYGKCVYIGAGADPDVNSEWTDGMQLGAYCLP